MSEQRKCFCRPYPYQNPAAWSCASTTSLVNDFIDLKVESDNTRDGDNTHGNDNTRDGNDSRDGDNTRDGSTDTA